MYGIFRPTTLDGTRAPLSVMAPATGEGRETWGDIQLPTRKLRNTTYQTALKIAGLPKSQVVLDEIGDNTLVRQIDPRTVAVTRLDVLGVGRSLWPVEAPTRRLVVAQGLRRVCALLFEY